MDFAENGDHLAVPACETAGAARVIPGRRLGHHLKTFPPAHRRRRAPPAGRPWRRRHRPAGRSAQWRGRCGPTRSRRPQCAARRVCRRGIQARPRTRRRPLTPRSALRPAAAIRLGSSDGRIAVEIGADRIGQHQLGLPPPNKVGQGRGQEGPGDGLHQAAGRQARRTQTAAAARRQHRTGDGRPRHRQGGDMFVAVDTHDLFDQIVLALDIAAPGGRRHRIGLAGFSTTCSPGLQDPAIIASSATVDAAQLATRCGRKGSAAVSRRRARRPPLGSLAAAHFEDHAGRHFHARRRRKPDRRRARSDSGHRTRWRACGRWRRCASDRTRRLRGRRRWWSRSTPLCSPPMTPPRPGGPASSAITVMADRARSSCRSSATSVSPCVARRAWMIAGQLAGVEDMQRPVEVEGEEVGDIDQRRDRAQPDGRSAGPSAIAGSAPFLTPRMMRPANSGQALSPLGREVQRRP